MLFLSIDDILADEAVVSGDPLPHSYILNFLFSRAPSEMRSPHQVSSDMVWLLLSGIDLGLYIAGFKLLWAERYTVGYKRSWI